MTVTVSIAHPEANDVALDPWFLEHGSGDVGVAGTGCRIAIGRPRHPGSPIVVAENGGSIEIEDDCSLGALRAYALVAGARIRIRRGTAFNGIVHVTAHEPALVEIGEGCLFASDSSVTSSDVHRIIDVKSSRRLNPAGNITIGDRVWFAPRSVIFGHSAIGSDSVVGWGAVVKGRFPANVVVAGVPAKIIRKRIRWEP